MEPLSGEWLADLLDLAAVEAEEEHERKAATIDLDDLMDEDDG